MVDNARAVGLYERAGFEREGRRRRAARLADGWRDEYAYAKLLDPDRARRPVAARARAGAPRRSTNPSAPAGCRRGHAHVAQPALAGQLTFAEGFRPMLFDLETDPDELVDLGADPAHGDVRERLEGAIFTWARRHHARITATPERVEAMSAGGPPGVLAGFWDEGEYEAVFGRPFGERG